MRMVSSTPATNAARVRTRGRCSATTPIADDDVAEVFTKVLNAVENGRGPRHTFAAYLFASVRHECGSIGRRNSRRGTLSAHAEASIPHPDHAPAITEAAVVRSAFATLPDGMRQVLTM